MKYAADFRKMARDALLGRWKTAVLTCFLASLLGATAISSGGMHTNIKYENGTLYFGSNVPPYQVQTGSIIDSLMGFFVFFGTIVAILGIVRFIVGGAARLGYAGFNLDLIERKDVSASQLLSEFYRLKDGFIMNLLLTIYIFLWTLLFIIPGIIKALSYSMTAYIYCEHPEYSANQAITESKNLMYGNKARLFFLRLSFIGWSLLGSLPAFFGGIALMFGKFGVLLAILLFAASLIAELCVNAYAEAAQTAFYKEISSEK